jgi:hypothetical protein
MFVKAASCRRRHVAEKDYGRTEMWLDQAPIDFHAYWRFTDSLYCETMILCDYVATGYILLEVSE